MISFLERYFVVFQFRVLDPSPDELEGPSGHLAGTLQTLRIHIFPLHDSVQCNDGCYVYREMFCSVFSYQSQEVL